ncbi:MAG TPA: hypothetical protein VF410_06415 [Rhizomicrobium sp.]|jgi:hypothetical protein
MTERWKEGVARRPLLAAIGAVAGIGAISGALYEASGLLNPWRGAYGDLLAGLGNRADAILIGKAVLAENKGLAAKSDAKGLREAIGHRPLAEVLTQDAVQGRIVETQGWVLPETLTRLCALAAQASRG